MNLSMELVICTADYGKGWLAGVRMLTKAVGLDGLCVVQDAPGIDRFEDAIVDGSPINARFIHARQKRGPVGCLQLAYEAADTDILALVHDDVEIHEPGWDARVLREFADPSVGVVGFGGATGLADDDIYQTPYRLQQLARHNYASNVDDAEVHGERFAGERDVAVLDGFCLIVRRKLLDKMGGWPTQHLKFHMYDAALACYAKRFGYRTRLVGVRSHHRGGQTSCRTEYHEWLKREFNTTDAEVHRVAHEWIAQEFRDVLPIRV